MKKLLVVVDYQKDFVDGSLGFPGAETLEKPICEKIEQYRKRGDDVAFTFDTHGEDYLQTQEGKRLPVAHCLRGSEGWQLYGSVARYCGADAPRFEKPGFGSEALARFAKEKGYGEIELCGLVGSICVISNAVLLKAALPEASVRVDARCTGGGDRAMQEKALDVMENLQIEVLHRS